MSPIHQYQYTLLLLFRQDGCLEVVLGFFKFKSYRDDKVLAWTLIHLIFILFYNPLEFYILFTFKTHLRLVFPSDILHHLHIYTTPDVENVKCKILYFTLKHNQHFANSC